MRLDSILSTGFGHGETQRRSRSKQAYVPMYIFTAGCNRTAGKGRASYALTVTEDENDFFELKKS